MEITNIKAKVNQYKSILSNTKTYRNKWGEIHDLITNTLEAIIKESELNAFVEVKDDIENLELITLSLGSEISGIAEKFPGNKTKRPFIKNNGALVFQQLFNGKIMTMIMYPYIEGYGQPKPPKTLEIVRPEELTEGFLIRYVEEFLKDIIEWEDFDDDLPEKMGMNPIGFSSKLITEDK